MGRIIARRPQALQMIREQGLSISHVCKELNLDDYIVKRWLAAFDEEQTVTPPMSEPSGVNLQRMTAMEEENRQLKSDNELLLRAAALFAREMKK